MGIPFFVFCCVVTKELLQKEDPLNKNIQLFSIDFCFSDFANNPESRAVDFIMSQPVNFQFNFLKPQLRSELADIYEIMHIVPLENSVNALIDFFSKQLKINLNNIEIKNRSIDLAAGKKMVSINDFSKETLSMLKENNYLDFILYNNSF